MTTVEEEPGKGGSVDDRWRREDKVIGRLDLDLVAAFGPGSRSHPAIRLTCGKEETGRGGRGSWPHRRCQDTNRNAESKECKKYSSVHYCLPSWV